ncbi:hypothetical protein COCMIDRAFT_4662 [Bipolaris oryzae ATCC 44560]|uniref:Clr5 domain-containing protein n=1 Tax=Bipolaris oryzae ATCC 44560 TaxID=930090 RepID=W6ZRF9_COCMI|nr:uncharacterized protein COCMIDRAFT_4662 [Bipolaris oryzae ATCC 44560]EUC46281.1 hypothetical protein COCMIDRAFT_4662 [Bipolaris oryzae ATCC 44560]
MASFNDSHAGSDTYTMDIVPPQSPPIDPAQASTAEPELSIEPSIPKRIGRSEWRQFERFVRLNYRRMELKELRKLILKDHGFVASTQQWKKALSGWNLSKSIPKPVAKFIGKKTYFRRIKEGKKTSFRYRKQAVPKDKIKRYTQKYASEALSPIASSPSSITYNTSESANTEYGVPVNQTNRNDVPARSEFYNGQDVDSFLRISQIAQTFVKQGNYSDAKLAFMEALEGLEALLGTVHKIPVHILLVFVDAAIKNKDFDGAMERLRKSYTHHQELLGDNDKKTWMSYSRLGLVYDAERKYGQALKTFSAARDGLRAASQMGVEDMFNLTFELNLKILCAYHHLGDLESAEEELCDLIPQAEGLGDAYQTQSAYFKHQLAHIYNSHEWHPEEASLCNAAPPRKRIEKMLLEAIYDYAVTFDEGPYYLCSLEQLRTYYETTGEVHKLNCLITEKIEPILSAIRPASDLCVEKYLELMEGTIYSLLRLREYEKADSWLHWRQQQIENLDLKGTYSVEALCNLMMHAKTYLDRSMPQSAEPLLEKAQRIAEQILPPGHAIHTTIAETIARKAWLRRTCCQCLVNSPNCDLDDTK